jgi:D-lactate dehydrogenase
MTSPIVFLDVEDADRALVLSRFPDATIVEQTLTGGALVDACKDAEVISTTVDTAFPKAIIDKLPSLKLLCTRSAGFDHLDLRACAERGIVAAHVPDYGSHIIAEFVFALLLGVLRRVDDGRARVKSGTFDHRGLRGYALKGKTMGILGTGRIGRNTASIANGFGMTVVGFDPYPHPTFAEECGGTYAPFDEVLAASDVLSLHLPSMEQTRGIINAEAFAKMKDGVVLVNTARGALIDEAALISALDNGKVGWALLDVLGNEADLSAERALIDHPRVAVTPHIAFYADESMNVMFTDCFDSIDQWKKGETPTHVVPVPVA